MYKEEIINLKIIDRMIDLIQITNIDEVFDTLIQSEKDNPSSLEDQIPYWTELWPSAIALAQYIEENRSIFKQKDVIELGAGLGLPSLVASPYCNTTLLTDLLPDAVNFAERNAIMNNLMNIDFQIMDWRNIKEENKKFDIILASDIAYEKRFFLDLPNAIKSLMHEDSLAIITEPGRSFAKPFIEDLSHHFKMDKQLKTIDHRGVKVEIGIYLLYSKY
jgi:predicted nicotinamide N-methyase